MKLLTSLLCTATVFFSCNGDDPIEPLPNNPTCNFTAFNKNFGAGSDDWVKDVAQTIDGGYVIAGYSNTTISGQMDMHVIKVDDKGNKVFDKIIGGSDEDFAYSVKATPDGGCIVAGYTESNDGDITGNHGQGDLLVIKLNNSGDISWKKILGGSSSDGLYAHIALVSDGYVITSNAASIDGDVSNNKGSTDVWVVKLNFNGEKAWDRSYGGSLTEDVSDVIATAEGGFTILATSLSSNGDVPSNQGQLDLWVLRLDAAGNKLWSKTIGGSNIEEAGGVAPTVDGGWIVTSSSSSTNGDFAAGYGDNDIWVFKLNASGSIVWKKNFGGSKADLISPSAIQGSFDGHYLIAGMTASKDGDITQAQPGGFDFFVLKLTDAGNKLGFKCFGGNSTDWYPTLAPSNDCSFVLAGTSESNNGDIPGNFGSGDMFIMRKAY